MQQYIQFYLKLNIFIKVKKQPTPFYMFRLNQTKDPIL